MSRWGEIVCDRCAAKGPGTGTETSAWQWLEKQARLAGWKVGRDAAGFSVHICPKCQERATTEEEHG